MASVQQWAAHLVVHPPCVRSQSSSSRPSTSCDAIQRQVVEQIRSDPSLAAKLVASLDSETLASVVRQPNSSSASNAMGSDVVRPSVQQLMQHAIRQSVPFVGFGFFDNVVMITVGDAIDASFGVALGFSTLAAAGFGQMVSDSVGIALQGVIERCADRLGLPNPHLSLEQERSSLCKNVVHLSRVVGIVFGCFLGMCPLLFLDTTQHRLVDKLLQLLPPSNRSEFWAALEQVSFDEGAKIIERGSRGEYLYLVTKGEVEVIGRDGDDGELHLCKLGPGNTIGELEFITEEACVADVVALCPVRMQRLSKRDFHRIVGEHGMHTLSKEILDDSRYIYYNLTQRSSKPSRGSHQPH